MTTEQRFEACLGYLHARIRNTMTTRPRPRIALVFGVGVLLLGLAFGVGWAAGRLQPSQLSGFPILNEALRLIRDHYLGDLPDGEALGRGMIRGLLQALGDPYTVLVEPAARELETDQLTGSYGGIGADLTRDSSGGLHLIPYPGGPADRAGIREGDALVSVDGHSLSAGTPLEQVTAWLRGPTGSPVRVAFIGADGGTRDIRLVRETYKLPSVTSYLLPDDDQILVVRISLFSETTSGEVDRAVESGTDRGARFLILDLRGNPGGLLEAGVDTARLFLADGLIASERRSDGTVTTYHAEAPGRWESLPLAIVVDGGTASAAEILAAALRRPDDAPLVGQPTLGKGSVQSIFPLRDGSSLHLTTAVWIMPDGQTLEAGGLAPDFSVAPESEDPDAAVKAAARLLRETDAGS